MRVTLFLPLLLLQLVGFNFAQSTEEEFEDITTRYETTTMTSKPDKCRLEENPDELTKERFTNMLTNACRYDRFSRPNSTEPTEIFMEADIKHIEIIDQLQFKINILVQYSYQDDRLMYNVTSPKRGYTVGEDKLRDKIWTPHIVVNNVRDTAIMGIEGKDVFVSISPSGHVVYSYRMSALIYCWMDLKKFPFDEQICDMQFKSWTYNASHLILKWAEKDPVKINPQLHLTEFTITRHWTNSSTVPSGTTRGTIVNQYSVLIYKFELSREIGFYIMDYFLPSIMLVCISWVTFWLQADNAAPRITLGTSTMLSFITLASGQSKRLPKVSYIKASEIWFLGCAMFIFVSIAEFAFVNIIWRRKKKVELIKVSSKYILKSAVTPRLARKEFDRKLDKSSSFRQIHKAQSWTSLDGGQDKMRENGQVYNNYLTVHAFPSTVLPKITASEDSLDQQKDSNYTSITIPTPDEAEHNPHPRLSMWTTMTPQEIAIWIDKRSRLVFPLAFLVFNIIYWAFVYSL